MKGTKAIGINTIVELCSHFEKDSPLGCEVH